MKVAFYKGKKRLFNRLVRIWKKGPYSHVELILDDGISISSSAMDGGVRYKRIQYTSDNWDFIDIGPEPDDMRDRINEIIGLKYDYKGIIGFVIGSVPDDKNKLFCSETGMRLLKFPDPWRFDPNAMYSVLKRMYPDG